MAQSKPIIDIDITRFKSAAQSLHYLQGYIKSNLLDRIRTGDPIYDTIIAFAVMSSQEILIEYLHWFKRLLTRFPSLVFRYIHMFIRWWRKKSGKPNSDLHVRTATVSYITEGREINTLFEPVMWFINSQTDTKAEERVSLETTKNNPEPQHKIPKERSAKITFLDHDIEYTVRTELIKIYAEREHTRENVIITLSTETPENRRTDIFEQFSEMCIKKYDEFNAKKSWKQQIFRNEGSQWKSQDSKTSRKLGTVILKENQMEDIINDINEFVHKEDWYVSRDVPYTRRYMFWGVPGTGKSSCIKALACHTKRHIHYLVLSEVESDSELFKLMESVDFSKTILVIEDIDCASRITHDRSAEDDIKDDSGDDKEEEVVASKMTLSGLLNAIDGGMVENHGQIMVMTTNHPEKLDPALVRPGRVDRKYEFGLCDTYQIKGLFHNFFEYYPKREYEFPSHKISPAQVTSIFLQYKKDPDHAWDQAISKWGHV